MKKIEIGENIVLQHDYRTKNDVHNAAAVIRMYLQQLPESLFTKKLEPLFLKTLGMVICLICRTQEG